MHISLVAVGKRMPEWVNLGVKEYIKRFPPELNIKIIEVPSVKRNKSVTTTSILAKEAAAIKTSIPKHSYTIALDERGKQHDTMTLSNMLKNSMQEGQNITFIIGGADGLDASIIMLANETWSLSGYTMPHALVRVFLVEQLYRACMIIKGHPYHRE